VLCEGTRLQGKIRETNMTRTIAAKHGGTIIRNATGTWTLRYWADGKQTNKTFRDEPGKPGSGRKLAEDFSLKLAVGKREGDVSFADKSKAAVRFVDYAGTWIDAHKNQGTRATLRSTLKLISGELGNRTLAQVAADREGAQRLIDNAPGTYARKVRIVLVSPCNEALKSARLASHRLRGLKVEEEIKADDFEPATRAQLDIMADALGDRGMIIWLGIFMPSASRWNRTSSRCGRQGTKLKAGCGISRTRSG
jgi:hypothetical protein